MSRAFVKEPDGDDVPDDLPDLPQSPHPNYVTPGGLAQLKRRLVSLERKRQGLLGESNALANKLPLAEASRQIRFVKGRIERAIVTEPAEQPNDRVCFGAKVEIEDEQGVAQSISIVGEDEADIEAGKVSWVSPLAKALLGAGVGGLVTWRRPAGDLEIEVRAIHYPGKETGD